MAIEYRVKALHRTRNEQIVSGIRDSVGADAPRDPLMAIKTRASELASLLALVHGGDWRVQIDSETVVVARRRPGRQRIHR